MSETYRMYASISFVAVLIVVGMPLWWKTTEVYRVSLPYSRISNLDAFSMQIHTKVKIASIDTTKIVQIKNDISNHFINSEIYHISFETIALPKSFNGPSSSVLNMDIGPGNLLLIEWPDLMDDVFISSDRVLFFKQNGVPKLKSILKDWIFTEDSLRTTIAAMSAPVAFRHDTAGQRRVPPSREFDISLSVASPNPDKIKVEWVPKDAIEQYFQPFVTELSIVHNFTLKSQWLYFVELDFNPKQVQDETPLKRHFSLPEEVLPHLITPLEKKLASHTSNNPCLNFILYTPPCELSPIHIYTKRGTRANGTLNAFLSPRWGGVVIGNPPIDVCAPYLSGDDFETPVYIPPTKEIMAYFLTQLRLLIGIPNYTAFNGVNLEPIRTISLRKWEMDTFIRLRTIEQVTSAKLTLRSLAQLLGEISNIVINDDVGASIYNAVENIEITSKYLKEGKLLDALVSSRNAFLSAEDAFTDPSLLALLYFPDDQKYAVYIPLYLPVMIPVIISLKNIWCWLRKDASTKEKTD